MVGHGVGVSWRVDTVTQSEACSIMTAAVAVGSGVTVIGGGGVGVGGTTTISGGGSLLAVSTISTEGLQGSAPGTSRVGGVLALTSGVSVAVSSAASHPAWPSRRVC